jgi:hypothetical protein
MAAVLYASATGATELRHLGYLERLGLWGPGRPHQSFEELRNALEGGGDGGMMGLWCHKVTRRFTINTWVQTKSTNEVPTFQPQERDSWRVNGLTAKSGGLAAMELLAMTMRAEGMLSCRSLSFKGPDGAMMIITYYNL